MVPKIFRHLEKRTGDKRTGRDDSVKKETLLHKGERSEEKGKHGLVERVDKNEKWTRGESGQEYTVDKRGEWTSRKSGQGGSVDGKI